jgi:hypothetical protein
MGSIPPISPTPPNYPSQPEGSNGQSIVQKLQTFMDQYRALMQEWIDNPSPANLEKVEQCMKKIKSYLENHESAIDKLCPSAAQFLNSTVNSINNFLQHPNMASLDMVNEQLTQLHWLIQNEN